MVRLLLLVSLVVACVSSQAQSNGGSTAAKNRRPACIFKPVELNGARTRDPRQIGCVLDNNKGGIYAIYRQALIENPKLSGTVEISFRIDANGRVQNAKIARSSINNSQFENKLLKKFEAMQWPAMPGVSWSGSHPISFYPG